MDTRRGTEAGNRLLAARVVGIRRRAWSDIDHAAAGLIYGAIMVLALLLAFEHHPVAPMKIAWTLVGSVVSIIMAKAFAEVMSGAIRSGRRPARGDLAAAWKHASPALVASNLPTLLIAASALNILAPDAAVLLSQFYCIVLLALCGGRVGWVVEHRAIAAAQGATFLGVIGIALAILKYFAH